MTSQPVGPSLAIMLVLCAFALGLMVIPAEGAALLEPMGRLPNLPDSSAILSPTSIVTVTNASDSGAGSLRAAILTASAGDTIVFSMTLPATITLTSAELLVNKSLTIVGPGADQLTISGDNARRVFNMMSPGGSVNLSGLSIKNGQVSSSGGAGILVQSGTVRITDTLIYNNRAVSLNGGGLSANSAVWLTNSAVISNSAAPSGYGGGIYNSNSITLNNVTVSKNLAASGGGLYNWSSTAVMTNVTLYNNRADNQYGSGTGGGISGSNMAGYLWNSTIYSNTALAYGGGINAHGGLTLTNVTISDNSASTGNGGNIRKDSGTLALRNAIVNNAIPESSRNCVGTVTSLGNNLDSGNYCAFSNTGDITNTNPLLGPLANNGGATQTMALLPGSPAIDKGNDAYCPATDQRGAHRPIGKHCDIGAYEAGYLFLPLIKK